MTGGLFVFTDQKTLVEMQPASFATEADFQLLIAEFPALLAGAQIDPASPRRWLLVNRESAIRAAEGDGARWSVDHLFLDQDGIPTLVEVKRQSDTRLRREVVGQMLDYAADNVVGLHVEDIQARLAQTCQALGKDPAEALAELIGPEADVAEFWQRAKTNLRAGRIRLLFVADAIPPGLRRVVEFLNQPMDPAEVLALELRQFEGQGLKTPEVLVIGR